MGSLLAAQRKQSKQGGVRTGQTNPPSVSHPHSHTPGVLVSAQEVNFKPDSKMDIASKNEFIYFMQRAVEDQSNDCYIELYNLLLRAFVSADCDFDGQVSQDEFGGMISAAAALPKKFGFDWWQGSPADMFQAIDDNGDGSVSFDEWLSFAYKNYQGQKDLPAAFDKEEHRHRRKPPSTRQGRLRGRRSPHPRRHSPPRASPSMLPQHQLDRSKPGTAPR